MLRVLALASMLALAACGGSNTTGSSPTTPPASATSESPSASPTVLATCSPSGEIELEAEDNQFDKTCLATRAGAAFTVKFQNRDEGTSHNMVITRNEDRTQAVFTGAPTVGKEDVNYNVPALAKGRYFYHCQFHPGLMTGTLIAA